MPACGVIAINRVKGACLHSRVVLCIYRIKLNSLIMSLIFITVNECSCDSMNLTTLSPNHLVT